MYFLSSYFAVSSVFHAYSQSDLFGKMIFLFLFILSIVSWVILIHKICLTKKLKKGAVFIDTFFEKNQGHFLSEKFAEELENLSFFSHPHIGIYQSLKRRVFEVLNKNSYFIQEEKGQVYLSAEDINLLESNVDAGVSKEAKKLEKNLFILSTIVTLAPFLGLLGTVWGILITFSHLQTHSLASGNTAILAGLSMALATTVVGLVVAIPALVAHNYLKHAVRDLSRDMEHFSRQLITTLEIQYRRA